MSQSCFTPEQEARIAEIVRDTLKAFEQAQGKAEKRTAQAVVDELNKRLVMGDR